MKKFLCTVLIACLLLISAVPVSADSLEETVVVQFVQNYLTANASAKYERAEQNLIAGTVSELTESQMSVVSKKLSAAGARSKDETLSIEIDTEIGRYFSEKAAYYQYILEEGGLEVTNLSTTYGKPEITVNGDTANVKIFETVSMRYTCLDEDSAESTEYDIDLVRIDGDWKISEIRSDDLFDKTHERDFQSEKSIAERQKLQAAPASLVQEVKSPDMDELKAMAKANNAKVYPYNHTNAVNYSNQYTTSTGSDGRSYYNSNFVSQHPADCMNFASQCMFAGFGGSDEPSIKIYEPPMDKIGNAYDGQWYYTPSGTSRSWIGTITFQDYVLNSIQASATENNVYLDRYPTGPTSAAIYDYMNRLPGSLVFVYDGTNRGHAMVIGKVTGPNDNQIFVSAHTTDKKLQPLSLCHSGVWFNLVVPKAYYCYSGQPQLRVTCDWKSNVKAGSTVTLSGKAERKSGGTCYRMVIKVVAPNGVVSWSPEMTYTDVISHPFTLSQKGLYKISIYARETYNSTSNVGCSMTLRTY